MKRRPCAALAAVFLMLFSGAPIAPSQVVQTPPINQTAPGVQSQFLEERQESRRRHFVGARQLLFDKGVPFEPEQLLDDEWPTKLKPMLDAMPGMHEVHYERAP